MKPNLQVLIVDDNEADARLMARAMERGGFSVQWRRAQSSDEVARALDEKWDVILCDFTMPQCNGLEVLRLCSKRQLDIPFLIVSGVIEEDMAVHAMKAGARDCIRKSNLMRLAPAIAREIREAERRRALNKQYEVFSRLGQQLSSASVPADAAKIIINAADELLGWDSCFLDLYAADQDKFYHLFDVDIVEGQRREVAPDNLGTELTPLLRKVLEEGPQLILRDKSTGAPTGLTPFGDKSRPSASIIIVPIRHGDQVLGFFSIQSYQANYYDADDLNTLQKLADHCAGALQRIRAQEELRASEKRYRILFDSNPTPIFVYDRQSLEILAVNEAASQLYGYSRPEFLAMTIRDIRPKEELATLAEQLPHIQSESKRQGSWRHCSRTGTPIDVEVTSMPLLFADRPARLALVFDITEQKKLQREILEISGREQRRIGHDLHDGLCQHLGGVVFLAQILADELAEHASPHAEQAQKITDLINDALSKTRSLARGLFPVRLEANGLVSALEELAGNITELFHIPCHFCCNQLPSLTDSVVAENLYYIAHEALMNAGKHSKARRICMELNRRRDRWILSITDDGVGIPSPSTGLGMGLRIMNYRARMIGAGFEITRALPTGGTSVTCYFSETFPCAAPTGPGLSIDPQIG